MLATLVDAPFHEPGWVWEEKYDGIRILAEKTGARVRLVTRNLIDRAADFPGVAAAIAKLPAPTLLLDGEVVVFDAKGVSRFQRLQGGNADAVYVVFDCLFARGRNLMKHPLTERREALEAEVGAAPAPLRLSRRLAGDGFAAYEMARRKRWEGIVAKREGSLYLPGVRSPAWRKVKVRAEEEFVVGGWTAPEGSRAHFGALLIGAFEGRRLRYAGKVGTGFAGAILADLAARFRPLVRADSPFVDPPRERGVTWLEPKLVAQVGFMERTADGRLRHPTYLGLREDKPAREVRWTPPPK